MATNYVLAEYCGEVKITEDSQHDVVIGSGITLYVGMSKNSNMTIVPQLIGLTLREAKSRLWELGFNVGRISYPEDSTPHNQDQSLVYSQGVSKGEELRLGRSVSLKLTFDKAVVDEILEAIAEQEREEEEQRLREEDSLARLRIMDLFDQKINGESQQGAVEVQEENLDSFFE